MIARNIMISLFTIFIAHHIDACVCLQPIHIDNYEYIALVEITGAMKSDLYVFDPKTPPKPPFYEIKIETIQQFKGKEQDFIIVHGGNEKYNLGWTSCDMSIEIGEQWIMMGDQFMGKIATGFCSLSIMHVNNQRETEFKYNRSIKLLDKLYTAYHQSKEKGILSGKRELYYHRDIPKLEENYKNGHLHGERIAFYSNRQLMLKESYNNGLKDGYIEWYNRDGTYDRISEYKDGNLVCEDYHYDHNGDLSIIHYYDDDGNFIITEKR